MVLLCAVIDSGIIKFIGRCCSDKMLRYLHVQAEPFTKNVSSDVVKQGTYTLILNHESTC